MPHNTLLPKYTLRMHAPKIRSHAQVFGNPMQKGRFDRGSLPVVFSLLQGDRLGVTGIPRFLIYDPDGHLLVADAPRPSTPAAREMLEKLQ